MSARRPRLWRSDDAGASLVFALVFITVISFVVIAVLSLADASMRATIKLRGQAAEAAAAEGAANIAVNALRESTYTGGGGCFGGTSDLSVPSSQLPGPDTMSALVSCAPDSTMAQFPLGAPAQTILTTAADSLPGITVNDVGNGANPPANGVRVTGNVYSNAGTLVTADANLTTDGGGVTRARDACSFPTAIITIPTFPYIATVKGTITPSAQCNNSSVPPTCPQCAVPSIASLSTQAPQAVPACAPIMTFAAGRYTDLAALNNRTSGSCNPGPNPIFQFAPGTYYFDFSPTTISQTVAGITATLTIPSRWAINKGSLIAGALARAIVAGTAPQMPDSCKSPVPTGASGWVPHLGEGVQFIFSGYSQVEISGNARVEICGAYAGTNAPIAIYAFPTTLLSVPALPPGVLTCDFVTLLPCIAVQAGTNLAASSPPSALYVRGAVVAENRDVNLRVDTDSRPQRYNGGVVARRVVINTSRTSADPAVFTVHQPIAITQRQTVAQLDVKVCSGQPSCTGGSVRLRARIQIIDPTGLPDPGKRQMTVLSWSVQR